MSDELWRMSAVEAVNRLRKREISPLELVEASANRIAEVGRPRDLNLHIGDRRIARVELPIVVAVHIGVARNAFDYDHTGIERQIDVLENQKDRAEGWRKEQLKVERKRFEELKDEFEIRRDAAKETLKRRWGS